MALLNIIKVLVTVATLFFGSLLYAEKDSSKTLYITDLEGRKGNIVGLVESKALKMDGGRLEFANSKDTLVFGGDLPDRGPDSIKIRQWLVDLKQRYPERVTLLWGNRDLNKLDLLQKLPVLKNLENEKYREWLEVKAKNEGVSVPAAQSKKLDALQKVNTVENQVSWWAEQNGIPKAIELHRQEMEELSKKPVTLQEAGRDYVNSLDPKNGDYIKYLKLGQLADVKGNVLYVHGGVSSDNLGVVPGKTTKVDDVGKWTSELNQWGKTELDKLLATASGDTKGEKSKLMAYGDATWDESVKKVVANHQSVIYPLRHKEDGNLRLPPDEVINKLKASGIDTVIVGHTPAGNIPVPLHKNGFLLVQGDTSYGPSGESARLHVKDGRVIVEGKTSNGELVSYGMKASSKTPYGKMVDNRIIIGETANGDAVAYKYSGYDLDEKVIPKEEIKTSKLETPKFVENQELSQHRDVLLAALDEKGIPLKSLTEVKGDGLFSDKKPILFSGASKFAFEDKSADEVKKLVSEMLSKMDPKKFYVVTGGTDHGVEAIVHEVARKKGFKILGMIVETTVPQEVKSVDAVAVVGKSWEHMLEPALKFTRDAGGSAVFVGGGGIVKSGIETAEKLGVDFHLMNTIKGASQDASERFKERSFSKSSELISKIKVQAAKPLNGKSSATTMSSKISTSIPGPGAAAPSSQGVKAETVEAKVSSPAQGKARELLFGLSSSSKALEPSTLSLANDAATQYLSKFAGVSRLHIKVGEDGGLKDVLKYLSIDHDPAKQVLMHLIVGKDGEGSAKEPGVRGASFFAKFLSQHPEIIDELEKKNVKIMAIDAKSDRHYSSAQDYFKSNDWKTELRKFSAANTEIKSSDFAERKKSLSDLEKKMQAESDASKKKELAKSFESLKNQLALTENRVHYEKLISTELSNIAEAKNARTTNLHSAFSKSISWQPDASARSSRGVVVDPVEAAKKAAKGIK